MSLWASGMTNLILPVSGKKALILPSSHPDTNTEPIKNKINQFDAVNVRYSVWMSSFELKLFEFKLFKLKLFKFKYRFQTIFNDY